MMVPVYRMRQDYVPNDIDMAYYVLTSSCQVGVSVISYWDLLSMTLDARQLIKHAVPDFYLLEEWTTSDIN